jgi:hypothetical protein
VERAFAEELRVSVPWSSLGTDPLEVRPASARSAAATGALTAARARDFLERLLCTTARADVDKCTLRYRSWLCRRTAWTFAWEYYMCPLERQAFTSLPVWRAGMPSECIYQPRQPATVRWQTAGAEPALQHLTQYLSVVTRLTPMRFFFVLQGGESMTRRTGAQVGATHRQWAGSARSSFV